MSSTTDNFLNMNKRGDIFSITSKLAEYSINPEWRSGYDSIINPKVVSNNSTVWKCISSSCEDIGAEVYKKVVNYIDNIGNIDVCEIHSLYSFTKLYGYNSDLMYLNFSFPIEILDLINIFSVNKAYLVGQNSILTNSSKLKIEALSGSDEAYLQYVEDIFYNTLVKFVNLQYRDYEILNGDDGIIWKTDVNKYTDELFNDDMSSSNDILLRKVSLNVPIYFSERIYVNDIQAGYRKMSDFSIPEQIILNMELERRAQARDLLKNISKYSYERENKVLNYFRFIILFTESGYTTEQYDLDIKKNLIISNSDILSKLIIYNNSISQYEIDYSIIRSVASKLVDLCIKISYIRENIKNQAQKYYMSGTENLLINFIRETLFTTLYNNTDSTSAFWRYSNSDNTLLNSSIYPNDDLKIDIINYIDPVEYFNIAATEEVSAVGTSGLNPRYWESDNAILFDGDITENELLTFYNKLGLDNRFTSSYDSSSITASSYSLSSFLSTVFNSGATSATSAILYPLETISGTLSATEKEIFRKYSGISSLGNIPFCNIKNSVHSSYQIHPFVLAFKQYTEAVRGIANLFTYNIPDLHTIFDVLKSRVDQFGNTINFWDNNTDFSGYTSSYELEDLKEGNINLYQDSPFNFNALREYLSDKDNFINNALTGQYYNTLSLTDTLSDKIKNKLDLCYNNIKDLENYKIYRYGKDTFGNVYMLYKRNNIDDERGQLWIRLKNHPIAFPAFILDDVSTLLSETGQISKSNINTLISNMNDSTSFNELGPLSATLSFNNITFTSTEVSSLTGSPNTIQTYIPSLSANIGVVFNDLSRRQFYTTDITTNPEISAYFSCELSGTLSDEYITFSPMTSTMQISSDDYYVVFNSGNMSIENDYIDINILCNNNIFSYQKNNKYFNNLNLFFDFGFNYNKDLLYIDYSTNNSDNYKNSNTLFGEVYNTASMLDRTTELNFDKYAIHNLETIPQTLINEYEHVDTIINEANIFYVFKHKNIVNISNEFVAKFYIFKYNKQEGLVYKFYSVPLKYSAYSSDSWKCTSSNSILSLAYVCELPKGTVNISNFVSGYETGVGGKTSFDNILDNTYDNGIGVIQFLIEDVLPLTYDSIKYFCRHTDCGFYPQYPGLSGINYFYKNPIISSDSFYRVQLFTQPSIAGDFIYEQSYLDTNLPISGAYQDLLSIESSAISAVYDDIYSEEDRQNYIYDTQSYPMSTAESSSYPFKWFRKYDLSGNSISYNDTLSGVNLSETRLPPSSYFYHYKEESYSDSLSSTYYPSLSASNIEENQYALFELDQYYTFMVKCEGTDNVISNLIFEKINNNTETIIINEDIPSSTFNYRYNTVIKTYKITLVDLQRKQFIIERL